MKFTIKRRLAALAVAGALTSAGCGSTSVAGHPLHIGYAADCAFHVWRAHHDVRTGHRLLAAFHVWRSVHNCPRVVH